MPICGKLSRRLNGLLLLNDRLFWIILTVGIHPKFSACMVSDWDKDSLLLLPCRSSRQAIQGLNVLLSTQVIPPLARFGSPAAAGE
ncbi:MAG: hypothetical protein ACKO0N_15190, partial [Planctomycetota bacterium]